VEDNLIENEDYRFVTHNDVVCVELLSGEYAGVVYSYSNVSVTTDDKDDPTLPPVLSFNFEVFSQGNYTLEELEDDYDFRERMGDVLVSIVLK